MTINTRKINIELVYHELPNYEDNQFLSISDLIYSNVSVSVLASAIEKHGIYTWDEYGRFGLAAEEGKAYAMHLLKIYYEWETIAPQERSYEDQLSPIEKWGCCDDNAYGHYGWPTKVAPDFLKLQHSEALGFDVEKLQTTKKIKSRGQLNHDPDLQQKANEIAIQFKSEHNRLPSRKEVAKRLAKDSKLTPETIERRIRKQW